MPELLSSQHFLHLRGPGSYLRPMFSTFRALVDELGRLNTHVAALVRLHGTVGPAQDRLEVLELSRAQFEADMEGLLLKAEGQLKAARAAEARERHMKNSYEKNADPFDPDSEEEVPAEPHQISGPDGYSGEAEGLQRVHVGLAPTHKTRALNSKWGIA